MAPPAAAPRSSARVLPAPAPSLPRRPPLRVFEPAPRRRSKSRGIRRSTIWVSGLLIVGSLFAVVVGDALITEGQVSLSGTESHIAAAVAVQKQLQTDVAQKAAPPVVVHQAMKQGLVAPSTMVYLPRVPLNVPLAAPVTTPVSTPVTTPVSTPVSPAGSTASSANAATATGSSTAGTSTGTTAATTPAQQ